MHAPDVLTVDPIDPATTLLAAITSGPAIQSPRISRRSSCRGFRTLSKLSGHVLPQISIGPTKRADAGSASLGMALTLPALGKPRMLKAAR